MEYFFSFAVALSLYTFQLTSSTPIFNLSTDEYALLAFKNAVTSDPNALLSSNWSSNISICNWTGVSCGTKHRRVTALNVSAFHLGGTIAPHLGNLTFLQFLDISFNSFTGLIPSELSNLRRLKELNVGVNSFATEIPSWLGHLSQLRRLLLNNNTFSGTIPLSLFNISRLQTLHLGYNILDGNIPEEIANFSNLETLNLAGNRITGSIPNGMFNISSLMEIILRYNNISGKLPYNICNNTPKLKKMYLSGNQFYGEIPKDIYKCRELEDLRLPMNYFSGDIPREFGNLSMLMMLSLYSNHFQGDIPKEIGLLTYLKELSLYENNLEGTLPQELGNLKILNMRDNSLSGSIPSSMFNLSALVNLDLQYFILGNNKLSGEIPSFITSNASKLTILSLHNNSFSGPMPNFGNLGLLQELYISRNQLTGAESPAHELKFLSSLTHCPYLERLEIQDNPLNGIIVVVAALMLIRRRKLITIPPAANISLRNFVRRRISYIELVRGTNSFSEANLLGIGSFGSVYKGVLSNGLNIAAKVFNLEFEESTKSFDTESEILSSIRHRNLLPVIGCCTNQEFRALILKYMPNGSLEKWLHSNSYFLNLMQRLNISLDVALALEYLHHGHTFPVVHCDIKPGNVLLDEDMTTHVGDFGISKLFDEGEVTTHTTTMTTIGYAAPEYGSEGIVSAPGDVYSYGILVLKMFTQKKPTDDMFGGELSLKDWVNRALRDNAVSEIVTPGLLSREDELDFKAKEECMSSILEIAMKCFAFSPHERIDMIQVGAHLHKIKAKVTAAAEANNRRGRR